jgi:hypothetical protein
MEKVFHQLTSIRCLSFPHKLTDTSALRIRYFTLPHHNHIRGQARDFNLVVTKDAPWGRAHHPRAPAPARGDGPPGPKPRSQPRLRTSESHAELAREGRDPDTLTRLRC